MARTVISPQLPPPRLIVPKIDAKKKLEELLEEGKTLQNSQFSSEQDVATAEDKKEQWVEFVSEYLLRVFDNETYQKEFKNSYGAMVMIGDITDSIYNFNNDMRAKINSLQSIIRRLDLIPELTDNVVKPQSSIEPVEDGNNKEVFIVHGHDEAIKEATAGYIRSIGLTPIILHEQANGGRTLIEKLEHYSEGVGFAIVLITPDDVGYEKNEKPDDAKPRARQNVIMELGYFVGKLKRKNVCVLYKENTELPTDLLGILYVLYDNNGEWKLKIAKELKDAGLKFNFEAALS
jgi:predicted nucleotide-binding protein